VNGVSIIGHGSSNATAVFNGIRTSAEAVSHDVNHHIVDAIKRLARPPRPAPARRAARKRIPVNAAIAGKLDQPATLTRPVAITGTGSYAPERVLTNAELEKLVDTTDEWIMTRTGIRERRIARPDETTSMMGAEAARRALATPGSRPRRWT
jgi:hypothetical protein